MKIRPALHALFAVALLVVAGCTSKPILNISDVPVEWSKQPLTIDDVSKAIARAAVGLGWTLTQSGPGFLVATLNLRSHVAMVDIRYSTKSYSITYRDSQNLGYDGTMIHRVSRDL